MPSLPHVLFICTGNYYRSRFAESYFRELSARHGLGWTADSGGLDIDNPQNVGPLSVHTAEALDELGVRYEARPPKVLTAQALRSATIRIAVDEEEHRPMLELRFPWCLDDVEFWGIEDIDRKPPGDALVRLRAEVEGLLARLPQGGLTADVHEPAAAEST